MAFAQEIVGLQRQRQRLHPFAAGYGGQNGDLPESRFLPQGGQHRAGAVIREGHAQDHGGNAALPAGPDTGEGAVRVRRLQDPVLSLKVLPYLLCSSENNLVCK